MSTGEIRSAHTGGGDRPGFLPARWVGAAITGLLMLALAFAGDRALAGLGKGMVHRSELRFSRLYRGAIPGRVLVLGNSRAVNAMYVPVLKRDLGEPVVTLAWNGVSAVIESALARDWLDRHRPPGLVLVEVSFLTVSDHQLANFTPYIQDSPRLTALSRTELPKAYYGCRLSHLYCLDSELTYRALYYLNRDDQAWVNRSRISPALIAETRAMEPQPVDTLVDADVTALRSLIRIFEEKGARVRLVLAPYLPEYARHLEGLDKWVTDVEGRLGRPVLDLSRVLQSDDLFADRLHLNERGATRLAAIVAGAVKDTAAVRQ